MGPAKELETVSRVNCRRWQDGGGRDLHEKVGSKYADFRVYAVEGVERK
jgi:hypothetical protein